MNRRKTLLFLIVAQALYLLFIPVWLFVTAMSAMGFNDASVLQHSWTWFFLLYVFSYPIALLAGLILGWVLFRRRKYGAALLWNVYPLLWIVSLICIIAFA